MANNAINTCEKINIVSFITGFSSALGDFVSQSKAWFALIRRLRSAQKQKLIQTVDVVCL
jgi:hypothetical protein